MRDVMDITLSQLVIAYIFTLIVLLIVRLRGIKREKIIVISTLRMSLQLTLMGYVLLIIFNNPSPWITCIAVLIMLLFAVFTVFKQCKYPLSLNMKLIIAGSIVCGSVLTILFFLLIIIRINPWYDPQYFIPISGMIIGNSMTGISLALRNLTTDINEKKHIIENSLMLGATPRTATHNIINNAFDQAILPTILNMMSMGIISLPGMMTGQILSGTLPVTAIKYQIAIMLAILGSVSLSVFFMLFFGSKTYFNKNNQLVL